MLNVKTNNHWGNLVIGSYQNSNIDPLMPILHQEFPNWNSKRIKSYMDLINNEDAEISGVLAAKNESGYYVGCLIFTCQQIDRNKLNGFLNNDSDEFYNVFVIENINTCIPILQKQIFLALVDEAVNIAKTKKCNYMELPTLSTQSYELVKRKYDDKIQSSQTFRTYIKL